jgi:hypothetical protein
MCVAFGRTIRRAGARRRRVSGNAKVRVCPSAFIVS